MACLDSSAMNATRSLLCLALCLPAALSAAEIYSWEDANGVKQFTQEAPPKGVSYRRIPVESTTPGSSARPNAARTTDTVLGGGPKTREAGLKLKAETLEKCAKARERIVFLEERTARRLFVASPDGGEPSRMTDEQFAAEMDAAKALESANCV